MDVTRQNKPLLLSVFDHFFRKRMLGWCRKPWYDSVNLVSSDFDWLAPLLGEHIGKVFLVFDNCIRKLNYRFLSVRQRYKFPHHGYTHALGSSDNLFNITMG